MNPVGQIEKKTQDCIVAVSRPILLGGLESSNSNRKNFALTTGVFGKSLHELKRK